jgi:hypothetical protein
MSTMGWTQSGNASSMLDKVQQAQQAQEDLGQVQAKAKALEEQRRRQTTVNNAGEGDKLRLMKEKDRGAKDKRKKKQGNLDEDDSRDAGGSLIEINEGRRKIDIVV